MKKKFARRVMVTGLCLAMTATSMSPAYGAVDPVYERNTQADGTQQAGRKASDSNAANKASSSDAIKGSSAGEKVWLMRNMTAVPEYLSDLKATGSYAGYGKWTMDKDFDTNKQIELKLAEDSTTIFEKGMTANSPAWITYDVSEYGGKVFFAYAGIHYGQLGSPEGATCDFEVIIDGSSVWKSGKVLKAGSIAEKVVVEIPEGAKELKLVTGDGGDGGKYDHGVWAKACIVENRDMLKAMDTLSVQAPSYLEVGAEGKMTVRGKLFDETEARFGEDIVVTCESDDEEIAVVEGEGGSWKIIGCGDGLVSITVTATNEATGESMEQSVDVLVGEDEENTRSVESPNGENKILFTLTPAGKLLYRVVHNADEEKNIMATGVEAGLVTNLGDFSEGLNMVDYSEQEVTDSYDLLGAKKSHVDAVGNEMTMTFEKTDPAEGAEDVTFSVIARAYDDGVAFRYQIASEEKKNLTIREEKTSLLLPEGAVSQAMEFKNHNEARETEKTNSQLTGSYCMPLLYESNGTYGLISEAALTQEYAGAALYGDGTGKLDIRFSSGDRIPTKEVKTSTVVTDPWNEDGEHPWISPWRFVVIGDLNAINGNTMAETLSPEAAIDTSWIEPGVCAWTWLNGEGTHSFETYKRYIDLAAEMGWEYVLLDEGWQPKAPADKKGYVYYGYYDWFDRLMGYADARGVGVFVWANNADLNTPEKQEVISEWAAKGVKGIKPDFFNSHSQEQMKIYMQLIEKTAENHMILNIHGAPKTTGERRTYPHLLTREGIHGAEQIIFDPSGVTARHNCLLPFVRNAVGPADYTPMLSVGKHNSPYGGGNTYSYSGHYTAGQMAAMPIIIETGINCMADRADVYLNSATRPLYEHLPYAWENSRVLQAELGKYVAIQRESLDGRWYIGAICDDARQEELAMDFLPEGEEFYAYIVEDGSEPDALTIRSEMVTSESSISLSLKDKGGALIMIQSEQLMEVMSITLNKELVELTMGSSETLTAQVAPADAKIKSVSWESSNEDVVKVVNGKLTPTGVGIAEVKAVSGSASAVCEVRVYPDAYAMAKGWSVINEDQEYWTIDNETTLTVLTQDGGIYKGDKNTANNEFMIEADRDFEISVKMTFAPNTDYQSAGLLILGDEDPSTHRAQSYAAVWRRYHSSFGGNVLNMLNYNGSGLSESARKADASVESPVWFKLRKEGSTVTSYISADGTDWEKLGEQSNPKLDSAKVIKAGVYAGNDKGGKPSIPAVFEDFTYQVLDGEATVVPFGEKTQVELMGIKLTAEGKTEYAVGEEFDLSEYTLTAYYSDRTEKEISGDECEVAGFDPYTEGEQEVTLTWQDYSVVISVNVTAGEDPEPTPDPTDAVRKELKETVTKIKRELISMNRGDYTADSWSRLEDAFWQAESALEAEDASQETLEAALAELVAARKELAKAEPDPEPTPDPEPEPEPTPGPKPDHSSGSSSGGSSASAVSAARRVAGVLVVTGTWTRMQDGTWQFTSGGRQYKNEWAAIAIPGVDPSKGLESYAWYRFDENGKMLTGWYTDVDGARYYLQEEANGGEGRMATGWNLIKNADGSADWYYFNPISDGTRGKLFVNTTTPDGYAVGSDGAWVQ